MSPSSKGFIRVRDVIPFSGKGVEAVVAAVRDVLANNRNAQKLVLEVGRPIVIEKLVSEEEAGKRTSIHDIVRNRPMEEVPIDVEKTPIQNLWELFSTISGEALEPRILLVGDKFKFQKWLKIQIPISRMSFFGIQVQQVPELDSDVFILCGTESREDELDDIRFSVKGAIP